MQGQTVTFQNRNYQVTKLLGKGKSAWSWLCESEEGKIVLKQIHDEPCSYYRFGDKYETEIAAYKILKDLKIPVPELLGTDEERRWIFKEYIHGKTAAQLISEEKIPDKTLWQLFKMSEKARQTGINLDYFPTNFIISSIELYYIDYEINPYDDAWNLKNWGLYY